MPVDDTKSFYIIIYVYIQIEHRENGLSFYTNKSNKMSYAICNLIIPYV